ncbi:hypothetical protein OF83DRAFT_1168868 [Amylostereum chailletii]|nr:hypothetical protein OF83DRAFT_1168868 [Amylostereum chailletii]
MPSTHSPCELDSPYDETFKSDPFADPVSPGQSTHFLNDVRKTPPPMHPPIATHRDRDGDSIPPRATGPFWRRWDFDVTLSLGLHLVLVFFHFLLVAIWAMKLENRMTVPASWSTTLSTFLNAGLQIFILVITAGILALMQPLAIRYQFQRRQTLTSLSDQAEAWSGLGASLFSLYRNICFPAALPSVVLILNYFIALTVLHITTPILMSVPVVDVTSTRTVRTVVGTPRVADLFPVGFKIPDAFASGTFNWFESSTGVGLLDSHLSINYPGLKDNRVYDTVVDTTTTSTNGTALVNYTDFQVSCGEVPVPMTISSATTQAVVHYLGKQYASTVFSLSANLSDTVQFNISDTLRLWYDDVENDATEAFAPSDVLVRIPRNKYTDVGRNVLMYSLFNPNRNGSTPIRDAAGSEGTPSTLAVSLEQDNGTFPISFQVVGCTLATKTGQTRIDTATNRLVDESEPGANWPDKAGKWDGWKPDSTTSNQLEDAWAGMFMAHSSVPIWYSSFDVWKARAEWSCLPPSATSSDNFDQLDTADRECHIPTVIERYLSNALFGNANANKDGTAMGDAPFHSDFTNATLATLQDALSRATAMTMWTAARLDTLSTFSFPDGHFHTLGRGAKTFYATPQEGEATIVQAELVGRLTVRTTFARRQLRGLGVALTDASPVLVFPRQLNILVLVLGTLASVLLLGLALLILQPHFHPANGTRRRDFRSSISSFKSSPLDGVGLLQVTALDNALIAERLGNIDPNDVERRRRAAMFPVAIINGRLTPITGEEDA